MFFRMETADGTPGGSPTGGAQIAESAATAAQAVSTALASQGSSSSSSGLFSGQLYKLLSRPQNFDPISREQEIGMWREWMTRSGSVVRSCMVFCQVC